MVIRTKSEVAQRTSGFASWAIGYAELYFSDVLCPDFGIEEFEKSLAWFDSIAKDRNFGK